MKDAVGRLGIPWEQLFDGKGDQGLLWTQFNVEDFPSFYVFDRDGRIVAKRARAEQLGEMLERLTAPR